MVVGLVSYFNKEVEVQVYQSGSSVYDLNQVTESTSIT